MANFFLIPMNFEEFDFDKCEKEYVKTGEILWQIPGTPIYNKRALSWEIKKEAKLPNQIKCGDIIYFYVCKLPSHSGKEKARILLRGVVTKKPQLMKRKDIYSFQNTESEALIIGMAIGDITTLNKEELENDFCYSREILNTQYRQQYPQGPRWLNKDDKTFNESLIRNLESSFKKSETKRDFQNLIAHFNRRCFFYDKLGTRNDHKTFKRKNGTDYFEGHHFIQQHASRKMKIDELDNIIRADANLVCLCSNCHNKLHYGRPSDINKMLDELWRDESIQELLVKNHFKDIIGVRDENEALNWIKGVYRLNNGESDKDIVK